MNRLVVHDFPKRGSDFEVRLNEYGGAKRADMETLAHAMLQGIRQAGFEADLFISREEKY